MPKQSHVINVSSAFNAPNGFTVSDNRIEDMLQRFLTPSEYVVWRQYLRFWGGDKKEAYPSLAYLSNATGLSEKTIRKCNKGLRKKKFLTYISGRPGRSNLYSYKPIEKIIKYYYGNKDAKKAEVEVEEAPIREGNLDTKKVKEILNQLTNRESALIEKFISRFRDKYLERYGYPYEVDERDAKILVDKANDFSDIGRYINLFDTFFKTKNIYIEKSDRSIYFFFRPTVSRTIIGEYNGSDKGRWESQSETIWSQLILSLPENPPEYSEIKKWILKRIKLSGGNKKRDEYVLTILVKRVREYLENNQ